MTSLEFIEKEIKKRIDNISAWGKLLKDDPNDKFSARCLNKYKEELEVLFKIKSELEAWEELKPEIKEHKEVLYEDELINVLVFALPYSANPKKYNAIKKAMEVEE